MPREYRHIKQYEKEILELGEKGLTYAEIGEHFGIERIKIKKFFERHRINQRKTEEGKPIKTRGRPCKKEHEIPPSIQKLDKLTQMRYVIASKDRQIKRLEMENELMRDFLSFTERKWEQA